MPYLKPERPEKVSAPSLKASKQRGERLVCLTAYDFPSARIVDEAGIDIILVGDSLGNVVLGYGNTVPVTLDEILIHLKAVRRAVQRALLVADMPYGSFHTGADDAVRNALRLVKEGGAEAIKLEGGHKRVQLVKRLVDEEIAVMGHIGLTPQSINELGAYRTAVTGRRARAGGRRRVCDCVGSGASRDRNLDYRDHQHSYDWYWGRRGVRHSSSGVARYAWIVFWKAGAVCATLR